MSNNRIEVLSPDGRRGSIDESERYLLNQGWRELTPEEIATEQKEQFYGQTGQQLKAAGEGFGRGISFGISDYFLTNVLGLDKEEIKNRKAANPKISMVSEFAGDLSSLIYGGALIKSGAKAAGLATKLGAKGIKGLAARGALEGGALSVGDIISEASLDENVDLSAENMVKRIGASALFGAITDPIATKSMGWVGQKFSKKFKKKVPKVAKEIIEENKQFADDVPMGKVDLDEDPMAAFTKSMKEQVDIPSDSMEVQKNVEDLYEKVLGARSTKQRKLFKELTKDGIDNFENNIKSLEESLLPTKSKLIGYFDSPEKVLNKLDQIEDRLGSTLGDIYEDFDKILDQVITENGLAGIRQSHLSPNVNQLGAKLDDVISYFKNHADPDVQRISKYIEKSKQSLMNKVSTSDPKFSIMNDIRKSIDESINKFTDEKSKQGAKTKIRTALRDWIQEDMTKVVNHLDQIELKGGMKGLLTIPEEIKQMNGKYHFLEKLKDVIGETPSVSREFSIGKAFSNPWNLLKYGMFGYAGGVYGAGAGLLYDSISPRIPNVILNMYKKGITSLPNIKLNRQLPKALWETIKDIPKLGVKFPKMPNKFSPAQLAIVSSILLNSPDTPKDQLEDIQSIHDESMEVLEMYDEAILSVDRQAVFQELNETNKKEVKQIDKAIDGFKRNKIKEAPSINISKYDQIVKRVKNINDNPEQFLLNVQSLADNIIPVAPLVGEKLSDSLLNTGQFLYNKLPQDYQDTQFFKTKSYISNEKKKEFLKYYKYVFNPNEALNEISKGNIDRVAIEVLQNLYPATLDKLKQRIMERADELQDLPYEKRKALCLALQTPLDVSFQNINKLQTIYIKDHEMAQQEEQMRQEEQMKRTRKIAQGDKTNKETEIERVSKS